MIRESLGTMIKTFFIALIICLIGFIFIQKKEIKSCNKENQSLRLTYEILQREGTKKETEYKEKYDLAIAAMNDMEDNIQNINAQDIGASCKDSIEWLKKQAIKEGE